MDGCVRAQTEPLVRSRDPSSDRPVFAAWETTAQERLCWLERAGNYFYGGNTGNSTVTGYRMDTGECATGHMRLLVDRLLTGGSTARPGHGVVGWVSSVVESVLAAWS